MHSENMFKPELNQNVCLAIRDKDQYTPRIILQDRSNDVSAGEQSSHHQ